MSERVTQSCSTCTLFLAQASASAAHMRATSHNGHYDDAAYKHKPVAGARRDVVAVTKPIRASVSSSHLEATSTSNASGPATARPSGAKRVRAEDPSASAASSQAPQQSSAYTSGAVAVTASMEVDPYFSTRSKGANGRHEVREDEDMSGAEGEEDDEDYSSSEELSESSSSTGGHHDHHQSHNVHIDDAASITSAEDDSEAALDLNLDPEGLVTLPPHLEKEACRRVAAISHSYEQAVVLPQMARSAAERQQALAAGEIAADIAAHDDELAQMGLDPEEVRDTSMVAEYAKEIFSYMARCEMETLPNPHYISYQNEIQWHMRATLVDWLLQVHMRYHMLPETLWIAVNIVDRFLSVRVVSLAKLQLVGVTAMFIAAKYEEIVAPSVDEFVFMTEGGYSKDEIFKGERIILSTLDFKVSSYCSPYSWVRKISKADDYDIQVRTLAKFLMEVTLLDHRFLRAKPSLIAAIGMFLSKKMLNGQWDEGFIYYSGFCEEQLIPGANLLLEKLADPSFGDHFVCRKYANRKFLKASIFARDWARRNSPAAAPVPTTSASSSSSSGVNVPQHSQEGTFA